jgi:hypothetical protein
VSIKDAMTRGVQLAQASETAIAKMAGAAGRHTLDGGRETIREAIKSDPRAKGYRRVTSANCCHFCAMLAARGVDGLSSDAFEAHDNCRCSSEIGYDATASAGVTAQARRFYDLYRESTEGVGGSKAQRNAFRVALKASRN